MNQPVQPYPPLTPIELADLTAMVWGAPMSEEYLQVLGPVIAQYEALRVAGRRPVDPVDMSEKEVQAHFAAQEAREAAPKATMFHDAGAIAQCGYCQRYTLDRKALSDRQLVCTCGEKYGWSGSFKPPGSDAQWHGPAPCVQPSQGELTGLAKRATDLHQKGSMPWNEADRLALSEHGIGDGDIDELIGEHASSILRAIAEGWEDLREYTRALLVHASQIGKGRV